MNRIVDIQAHKDFVFEASQDDLKTVEGRFDFEHVPFIKGKFNVKEDKSIIPCLLLEGTLQSTVKHDDQEINIQENIELYLVKSEADIEQFDLVKDVELLEDGRINIGEIVAQYIYLHVVNLDE